MKDEEYSTAVWSIGTAVPAYRISQEQALRFMRACFQPDAAMTRRLNALYRRSHIDFRYSCCADFSAELPEDKDVGALYLFGEPGTGRRMQLYEAQVVGLAEAAATRALALQQDIAAADITHLVMVTCTGFFAPGPDLGLIERLGLRPDVRRLQIGFMGCHAALQGLHAADAICRSETQAVVMLVCAELCTLHFQHSPTEENFIISSLFGDGAAAAVISGAGRGAGEPLCHIDHFASCVVPEAKEQISWRIEDRGFRMGLAFSNAKELRRIVPDFVTSCLEKHGWCQDEISLWAVHPGGRAILDACERALGLEPEALAGSRSVLRSYGNMSSPTVLFVMERLLTEAVQGPAKGFALAFGPGLSLEGMLWHRRNGHGGL